MKNLPTLFIITLLLTGCSQVVEFSQVEVSPEQYPFNSRTTVGDFEWVGRVIGPRSEDEDATYQFVKIDAEGNEELMYESMLNSFFPEITVEAAPNNEDSLVLSHVKAYPEGGDKTMILFKYGVESMQTTYDHFWGFVQEFTLSHSNSNEYAIEIETSNECSDYPDRSDFNPEIETEVLGLKFISEDGEESFPLENAIQTTCMIIDKGLYPPTLRFEDIEMTHSGLSITLPGGIEAIVSEGEALDVTYQ